MPLCVCTHPDEHAVLEAHSSGAEICTFSRSSKHRRSHMCGWAACTYLCSCLHSLQRTGAPGPPRLSLPCGAGLVWTVCHAQSILHWTIPLRGAAPTPLQGSEGTPRPAVPLRRTGYATPGCSPGKPSLVGSSGSAQPDLPACTPGAVKQRAGHQQQPKAPTSWCCAPGKHWRGGKALTI